MSVHDANKGKVSKLRAAFSSCDADQVRQAIFDIFAPTASIRLQHPFRELTGPSELWDKVYAPLFGAMPDLERRDFILMAGPRWGERKSGDWVGLGGNFVGTFSSPWLNIPPTGKPIFMRYHEYLRFEAGKVVEMEGLWDIPQLMFQADAWPMGPQKGVEWMCPGPIDGAGIVSQPHNARASEDSARLVWDMLHEVQKGTANKPAEGLGGFWHDHAIWYGPTGFGAARGHAAIANDIFLQFRRGLSNNTRHLDDGVFFADGNLVAFTGWPSGTAVHSGEYFLGLAPSGKTIERSSLDFWHIEDGLIRECWVMLDVIDLYRQIGVNVFERMHAMQEARNAA
ncbi:MAG: ester cyclase [Rhodobacteraceae bacterium]|nr:ester cyclase [Paracoccaceae bacterium]